MQRQLGLKLHTVVQVSPTIVFMMVTLIMKVLMIMMVLLIMIVFMMASRRGQDKRGFHKKGPACPYPFCTYLQVSEKGEVLLRGVGAVRYIRAANASVRWQPDGLAIRAEKWFLGAGFLGAPPTSLTRNYVYHYY